mgnify:CR=1 FL=1
MKHIDPWIIHWVDFTDYYKVCDSLAMRGATYALVYFDSNKSPSKRQLPSEFEECVYIGKSANNYFDTQGKVFGGKVRSHIHKRMTSHFGALTRINGGDSSHKSIKEVYGVLGNSDISNPNYGKRLMLCLMIPPPDVPDAAVPRWCLTQEQIQLYSYEMNFNHTTLGNMDTNGPKDKDKYLSYTMKNSPRPAVDLMDFCE